MRRTIKPTALRDAALRISVADYEVKGADGWAIKRGNAARWPGHLAKGMGVMVGDDFGTIRDIYKRTEEGPVLVDVERDASAACGLATWPASETRRSDAKVVGWEEALGNVPS